MDILKSVIWTATPGTGIVAAMNPQTTAFLICVLFVMGLSPPVVANDNGFLLARSTRDTEYSGGASSYEATDNFYDGHGNLSRSVTENDWDGDGIADVQMVSTWSYDTRQRPVLKVDVLTSRSSPQFL